MGSNGLPVWLGNRLECLLVLDDPVSPSSLADPFTRQCSFVIVASSKTFVCSSVRSLLIFHMLKGREMSLHTCWLNMLYMLRIFMLGWRNVLVQLCTRVPMMYSVLTKV